MSAASRPGCVHHVASCVSLEDVVLFSARSQSSTASHTSTTSHASTATSRSMSTCDPWHSQSIVCTLDAAHMHRHILPPLHPSLLCSSMVYSHHDVQYVMHLYILEQQYSPTSSTLSWSPTTPLTPFFTVSEASLEDEDKAGVENDTSRINMNAM